MDWGDILRDRLSMRNQTLAEREKQNIYLFDYRLFLDKSQDTLAGGFIRGIDTLAGGFIRGINVEKTLRHYLRQPEDIDFKTLPRPFGCIATDLVTDSQVVLDHGSLPRSIRASMAVPGVFAPVRMDPYILVDGGTKNNFPADLARKMGADIVIGVRTDLGLNDKYYSTSDILERSVGADIRNRSDENDKYCDLIIRVPVRGYSAAHFYRSAIKELIKRGEEAARAQMDSIMLLAITGLVAQPADNRNRKKVAVVLCGGGAMGTIHIGALKVLEEAGIPIDMHKWVRPITSATSSTRRWTSPSGWVSAPWAAWPGT